MSIRRWNVTVNWSANTSLIKEKQTMPLTVQQHSKSLAQPPLCEQLKVRDIIDDVFVELNGAFVAGYTVSGINSYYASDEERNRTKLSLEALVRSLPE